jgi:hypothetical protein
MDNDYFFYYDMINIYSAAMILASEVWSAILSILYLFIYLLLCVVMWIVDEQWIMDELCNG